MWPLNRYLKVTVSIFVTLLCVYLLGLLRGFFTDIWAVLSAVIYPFLASLIVCYILEPIVDLLTKRRVPRTASILLIYFVFLLIAVVAVLNAVPIISRQVTQLIDNFPTLMTQVNHWIDAMNRHKQYLPDTVRVGMENVLTHVEKSFTGSFARVFALLSGAVSTIFIAFVIPFLVFYMLKDARAIGHGLVRLAPPAQQPQIAALIHNVHRTLGNYIRGQLLVMLSVGILVFVGYLVIGMPYALLLALTLACADIVPYLGPFIGAAPAVVLALAISPAMVLKVIIVNLIVQQCEGNLISPQIMGKSLHLHPMAIVASLLIGGEIGGILGLIMAVPMLAVMNVIWIHVREQLHPTNAE